MTKYLIIIALLAFLLYYQQRKLDNNQSKLDCEIKDLETKIQHLGEHINHD